MKAFYIDETHQNRSWVELGLKNLLPLFYKEMEDRVQNIENSCVFVHIGDFRDEDFCEAYDQLIYETFSNIQKVAIIFITGGSWNSYGSGFCKEIEELFVGSNTQHCHYYKKEVDTNANKSFLEQCFLKYLNQENIFNFVPLEAKDTLYEMAARLMLQLFFVEKFCPDYLINTDIDAKWRKTVYDKEFWRPLFEDEDRYDKFIKQKPEWAPLQKIKNIYEKKEPNWDELEYENFQELISEGE